MKLQIDVTAPGVLPAMVEVWDTWTATARIIPGTGSAPAAAEVTVNKAGRGRFDETFAAFLLWERWRCYGLSRSSLPVRAKRIGAAALARLPVLERDILALAGVRDTIPSRMYVHLHGTEVGTDGLG
jgi:hypothetical protein